MLRPLSLNPYRSRLFVQQQVATQTFSSNGKAPFDVGEVGDAVLSAEGKRTGKGLEGSFFVNAFNPGGKENHLIVVSDEQRFIYYIYNTEQKTLRPAGDKEKEWVGNAMQWFTLKSELGKLPDEPKNSHDIKKLNRLIAQIDTIEKKLNPENQLSTMIGIYY